MKIIKSSDFVGRPVIEKNDCAIKAFSIISGKTWTEINAMFVALGRKPNRGVSTYMCDQVAAKLGLEKQYQCKGKNLYNGVKTLKQFKDEYKQATAVLLKRGHAFAYEAGQPCDYRPIGNSTKVIVAYFKKASEKIVYQANAKGQYQLPL